MELNKSLQKQIDKFLPEQHRNDAELAPFIEAVSKMYFTYERDKRMSDHSFDVSEREYQLVLNDLHLQNQVAQASVLKIKALISSMDKNFQVSNAQDFDLISIISFLESRVDEAKHLEEMLIVAKEEAEAIAKAKGNFLSVMSHEIRTPLNAIIGSIHILQSEEILPTQKTYIDALHISSENLLNLINDVLDFNKIDEGKIVFARNEINIRALLSNIKLSNIYRANESHNTINLIFDEALPDYMIGDETRLSQILNNLLSNAIKFTENGTIFIDISLVGTTSNQLTVFFKIKDTGIGIAPQQLANIFERFTQADSNINRKFGGSGLGLTIVKKLLQLQQTDISVESTVGVGTSFSFELTFEVSHKKLETDFVFVKELKDLLGLKILLVEDNSINIMVAKKMLLNWNAIVDVAVNGELAIAKFKENEYDIILMDLQMPIMDGLTASKEIRALGGTLPIVALTASALDDVKYSVEAAGMNGYISKPFNPEELYATIKQLLLVK